MIAFATGNAGKVALARAHQARLGVEVEHVPVDLEEIQSASVQAFESVLVYRADDSDPRAYVDLSATGTIAQRPADEPHPDAWSPLWDVCIPTGCDRSMSALTAEEVARVRAAWRPFSVFTQLGRALADGG